MTQGEKAKLYDQLLAEHSRKASQVRELETNITPAAGDQKKINELKIEMSSLEKRATELAMQAY
jgi:hypothetical protein